MTKRIELTKNKFALIDDIDADLANLNWYAHNHHGNHRDYWYVTRGENYRTVFMHKRILERVLGRKLIKGEFTDHINHDGLDNRRMNLRIVSRGQNIANQLPRDYQKSSKFKGVYKRTGYKRWIAQIRVAGEFHYLGSFSLEKDAAMAYDKAAKEHFGQFANLNKC